MSLEDKEKNVEGWRWEKRVGYVYEKDGIVIKVNSIPPFWRFELNDKAVDELINWLKNGKWGLGALRMSPSPLQALLLAMAVFSQGYVRWIENVRTDEGVVITQSPIGLGVWVFPPWFAPEPVFF